MKACQTYKKIIDKYENSNLFVKNNIWCLSVFVLSNGYAWQMNNLSNNEN